MTAAPASPSSPPTATAAPVGDVVKVPAAELLLRQLERMLLKQGGMPDLDDLAEALTLQHLPVTTDTGNYNIPGVVPGTQLLKFLFAGEQYEDDEESIIIAPPSVKTRAGASTVAGRFIVATVGDIKQGEILAAVGHLFSVVAYGMPPRSESLF